MKLPVRFTLLRVWTAQALPEIRIVEFSGSFALDTAGAVQNIPNSPSITSWPAVTASSIDR